MRDKFENQVGLYHSSKILEAAELFYLSLLSSFISSGLLSHQSDNKDNLLQIKRNFESVEEEFVLQRE